MKTVIFIFIGTLCVAGSAGVHPKQLLLCGMGGLVSHIMFVILKSMNIDDGMCAFVTAAVVTLYAEIIARRVKTPVTVFLYSAIVPVLPGRSLFYTVLYLIERDSVEFIRQGMYTLILSLTISLGIVAMSSVSKLFFYIKNHKIK